MCVWDRVVYVSFAKEPYERDNILRKRPVMLRSLLIVVCGMESERGREMEGETEGEKGKGTKERGRGSKVDRGRDGGKRWEGGDSKRQKESQN